MKHKFFTIILIALLSLPICTWAVDDNIATENPNPVIETVNKDSIEEESIDDKQYKQPYSKRKIAKKFLFAMGGVTISSFAIFFLLTIYNRIRENYLNQIKNNGKEDSLETPDDLNSAVKCFLNKTKWS